jgi:VPDSG-CTERM motif
MKTLKYLLALAVAYAALGSAPHARALLIHDTRELGFVNYGIPSGDADRTLYVNHLIGMTPGTSDSGDGQDYTRSIYTFGGNLPSAVWALNGTTTTIDLGSNLYSYILAKYDGPNYGSEVWYIGDLSGSITIPALAGKYGLSGWTLFGPGGDAVPDGGSTLALLGLALIGAATFRAKLQKA